MTDAELQKLFISKFAPARAAVLPLVHAEIEPRDSYYEEVLEPESIVSQADIVASLIGIWRRLRLPALVALEPDIRRMARELSAPDADDPEVSSFIYAMY